MGYGDAYVEPLVVRGNGGCLKPQRSAICVATFRFQQDHAHILAVPVLMLPRQVYHAVVSLADKFDGLHVDALFRTDMLEIRASRRK